MENILCILTSPYMDVTDEASLAYFPDYLC
jgi:hypothetical protein